MQYKLTAADLEILLSISRAGTLAGAGERLGVDSSTVFRSVQKIERGLGLRLFVRSRSGYLANETAQMLITQAEQIEASLEAAKSSLQQDDRVITGSVRVTTTDTILHGLITPGLHSFKRVHPLISFELHAGNELVNLTKRDADIAVRATQRPPSHLIGKRLGNLRVALFMPSSGRLRSFEEHLSANTPWIAPDDALPEHPSVLWRKKHAPKAWVQYRVNSILTVAELIGQGLGIGILPLFLARGRKNLRQVGVPLEESDTPLWILTHTDSRHLRRVAAVFDHLARNVQLE
jgi:DNA-binding transcriptional LysR family regulator